MATLPARSQACPPRFDACSRLHLPHDARQGHVQAHARVWIARVIAAAPP